MEKGALQMLSLLQKQYHPGEQNVLSRYLFSNEREALEQEAFSSSDGFRTCLVDVEEFIHRVHYSWWTDAITTHPDSLQPYLLAALPEKERGHLEKILGVQTAEVSLGGPVKRFFLRLLYNRLYKKDLPPISFLPDSPFLPLVHEKKSALLEMIDLLGLYDIAEEILQIVDKKNLAALYNCLSPKKRTFLKQCLQHKERVSLSKLGLENWSGEKKKLDDAIHRRGLFRFGKALQQESPFLLWYVFHRLDRGRAKIVEQYSREKKNKRIQEIMSQELLTVMSFLQIGSPS